MTGDDEKFMREALHEAKKAFSIEEVPVGAVLVHQGKIISRAHNRVEESLDASNHAELLCLRQGASVLGNWRLIDCTLYTTLEPCVMCSGASILFRLKRLVYGAPDIRHGGCGSVSAILNQPHPIHCVEIEGGVLADEAKGILQQFFRLRRQEACEKNYSRN